MEIIKVYDVSKNYRDIQALGRSISNLKGRIYGLLGETEPLNQPC